MVGCMLQWAENKEQLSKADVKHRAQANPTDRRQRAAPHMTHTHTSCMSPAHTWTCAYIHLNIFLLLAYVSALAVQEKTSCRAFGTVGEQIKHEGHATQTKQQIWSFTTSAIMIRPAPCQALRHASDQFLERTVHVASPGHRISIQDLGTALLKHLL